TITLCVEMPQRLDHAVTRLGMTQNTGAVTIVQPLVDTCRKQAVILMFILRRQWRAAGLQPCVAFGFPRGQQGGRQRIAQTKGNEIRGARLIPMRQIVSSDAHIGQWIKKPRLHVGRMFSKERRFSSDEFDWGYT